MLHLLSEDAHHPVLLVLVRDTTDLPMKPENFTLLLPVQVLQDLCQLLKNLDLSIKSLWKNQTVNMPTKKLQIISIR